MLDILTVSDANAFSEHVFPPSGYEEGYRLLTVIVHVLCVLPSSWILSLLSSSEDKHTERNSPQLLLPR